MSLLGVRCDVQYDSSHSKRNGVQFDFILHNNPCLHTKRPGFYVFFSVSIVLLENCYGILCSFLKFVSGYYIYISLGMA